MQHANETLLHFPAPTPIADARARERLYQQQRKASPADHACATARDIEVLELCSSTRGALQELRHGIIYALYDILDKLGLDIRSMMVIVQQPGSVCEAIVARDLDELTTETLIDIVERLHSRPKL